MAYQRLVKKILKQEGVVGEIEVSFAEGEKVRELNRRYRKKDRSTDVLSFAYGEKDGLLGDVIICREVAKKNAPLFGNSYRQELKRLVVHGVLHVLGYDHGRKMSDAEKTYQQL
jgi:probable rRNA maturation factor